MKKSILIIGIIMVMWILAGCSTESNEEYIEKQISIEIPNVLNIEYMDDHGGFHGDGERFAKIKFDDNNGLKLLSQIDKSEKWNKMPLTDNLNLIMYGGVKNDIEYSYNIAEKFGIPAIKNGYWYFNDRHSKSISPENDTELFDRHSFNFTLSMFDADDNVLYYFEFDT